MAAASRRQGRVFAPKCKPFPTCSNCVKVPLVSPFDFYQELFLRHPVQVHTFTCKDERFSLSLALQDCCVKSLCFIKWSFRAI